jgi:cell fate regulator YaaT (PSP1 superfamily)
MNIVSVKFYNVAKCYQYDPAGHEIEPGEHVVVESERGIQIGKVVKIIQSVTGYKNNGPLKKIIRKGTDADLAAHNNNLEREKFAHKFCLEKVEARELPMKLVRTEYLLDGSKAVFYFTADGRIDFRELVKDLAQKLKTRIEMRQIGVRDEARMMGGVGSCGKELCCASHLKDFEPITVKLAKDQNLAMNPAKLSGLCGRLLCCLMYEHEIYAMIKNAVNASDRDILPEDEGESLSLNYEDDRD